jgi:hypothetical protein
MSLLTLLALLSAQPGPVPPAALSSSAPGRRRRARSRCRSARWPSRSASRSPASTPIMTAAPAAPNSSRRWPAPSPRPIRDGSGDLGYLEYSRWAETWLGSQSALPGPFAIDADGDTRLSREEFLAEFRRQFVRLDKNGDGAVSRAELLTVRNPGLQPLWDRNGRPIRPRPERERREPR